MSEDSQSSLEQLRRKVATFPTDTQGRFELGAALHAQADYYAAIRELHAAMSNPHCACRAMSLLIEAYQVTGRPERAALIKERFLRQCGGEAGLSSAPAYRSLQASAVRIAPSGGTATTVLPEAPRRPWWKFW